jgi:hypothetical protein
MACHQVLCSSFDPVDGSSAAAGSGKFCHDNHLLPISNGPACESGPGPAEVIRAIRAMPSGPGPGSDGPGGPG